MFTFDFTFRYYCDAQALANTIREKCCVCDFVSVQDILNTAKSMKAPYLFMHLKCSDEIDNNTEKYGWHSVPKTRILVNVDYIHGTNYKVEILSDPEPKKDDPNKEEIDLLYKEATKLLLSWDRKDKDKLKIILTKLVKIETLLDEHTLGSLGNMIYNIWKETK